jgi:hypothetical protein
MDCPHCGETYGTGEAMFDHVSQHRVIALGIALGLLVCGTCWHLKDAVGCQCRWWCPLYPCNPGAADRPDAAGSLSFPSEAAYERHLTEGHFLQPRAPGVPSAFVAPRPRSREAVMPTTKGGWPL